MRRLAPVLLFLLLIASLQVGCASRATGWASTTRPYLTDEWRLDLLILGDWGTAKPAQRTMADAIVRYMKDNSIKFDACLSPGDNFYVDLEDENDPQWEALFEKMYPRDLMDFPWYCVLGNHDYEGNKKQVELRYAQTHPMSRFKMPSNWYRLTIPSDKPLLTILAVDSCKGEMPPATWETQKVWLASEVQKPRETKWLLWLAHHPPFSNGKHGDNQAVQDDWGGYIRQSKADFYVAGHEHSLQHLEITGWPTIIVSGGGGQRLVAMRRNDRGPFSRSAYGFAHMTLTEKYAEVRFLDSSGRLLHLFTRTPEGKVEVWATSPSDPATSDFWRSLFGQ